MDESFQRAPGWRGGLRKTGKVEAAFTAGKGKVLDFEARRPDPAGPAGSPLLPASGHGADAPMVSIAKSNTQSNERRLVFMRG